jgi:phage terminase large subunit GpA-like protein
MTNPLAGAWSTLRPPPLLTVSQWADRHRMLDTVSSAEPGKWRTSRTPYLREPMDRLSPTDPCERVVMMFGAQLGKTEAGLNWCGYIIHHQPAPLLLVQPSLEMAELYAEQRMAPMLRSTPELAERVGDPKQRDSGNKKLIKQFPGGFLRVVGANSPSSLAGMPARYIFGDEVDRWPASAGLEGSPLDLVERRTASFSRRKMLLTSTPTSRGSSLVERLMLQTGWRRYWVPCPHCSHMQVLGWSGLQWPAGKPRSAEYHCEACGAGIVDSERTKTEMLEGGEWRPDKPELEDGRSYGYHLPTLYAPGGWSTVSWGALAEQYDACGDNPDKMRVFVNTVWAETFDESELAAVDADGLAARAEVYARPVPDGVRLLTAGVDVQQDRLEVEIVGWGDDEESWSIDYAAIPGDPTGPDVWAELTSILRARVMATASWRRASTRATYRRRFKTGATPGAGAASWRSKASAARVARCGPRRVHAARRAAAGGCGSWASTARRMCCGVGGRLQSLDPAVSTRPPTVIKNGSGNCLRSAPLSPARVGASGSRIDRSAPKPSTAASTHTPPCARCARLAVAWKTSRRPSTGPPLLWLSWLRRPLSRPRPLRDGRPSDLLNHG